MSRILAAVVLTAALTAGCSSSKDGADDVPGGAAVSEANGDNKAVPRVALVMKSLANEFFATMAEGARQHQQDSGQYELIVNGIRDETDLSGQVSLVEQMMAQQVDAIVIAPADSRALVPVLKRAQQAGIVVINIDNKLDDSVLEKTGAKIAFVGPDNREGARRVGDYLAGLLPAGSSVAILEGIQTSFNGQQRKLGFEEAMQAAGLTIATSQSAQWEMSTANQVTSSILTSHPEIRAILACNDSMALGAIAAIRAAGRTDVKVVGFDNISAVRQALANGQMSATADQHAGELAVYGIEYALQAIASPETELPDRQTPVDLITAESEPTPQP